MNPKVDEYLSKAKKWQKELTKLRKIVLDCGLNEELKWRQPCYTFNHKNILIISAFKEYCALNIFNGALLKDTDHILVKPGENTQSGRQIRFTSLQQFIDLEPVLKAYIYEAIEVEKAGLKVKLKKTSDYTIPEELQSKFIENSNLQSAFDSLTPGRQRAYLIYFSAAKQSKTRESRIEKYIPRILDGKGINDCVCGLSKRFPVCDGSHKFIKQ